MNLAEHLAANRAKLEKHQDWKWWKDEAYKAAARAEAAEKDAARYREALQRIEDLPASHAEEALLIASVALEAKL